jgi:hypothetical protein
MRLIWSGPRKIEREEKRKKNITPEVEIDRLAEVHQGISVMVGSKSNFWYNVRNNEFDE